MKQVLQKCGGVKTRVFMELLKDLECKSVITAARKVLPEGTTGLSCRNILEDDHDYR